MAQVWYLREHPVRDGLALLSSLSLLQVASGALSVFCFQRRNTVFYASLFTDAGILFQLSNHPLTEEVPACHGSLSHIHNCCRSDPDQGILVANLFTNWKIQLVKN